MKLSNRWNELRYHDVQARLMASPARYKVVPAGRRSGKTERAKRHIVRAALKDRSLTPFYFCAAPTRDQAKKIYWDDIKSLTKGLWYKPPSESHLIVYLVNGAQIHILGMDRPERIEGSPWAGGVLDEYANMKEETWTLHVQPALDDVRTPDSWCWFIGVPEGRNHYYELYQNARGPWNIKNGGAWDTFTWKSSDILTPQAIKHAKETMDELSYRQEYEGSFVNFSGQAYYPFEESLHCDNIRARYNPGADLIFCFDFNVEPGVAAVIQELDFPRREIPTMGIEVDGSKLFKDTIMDAPSHGTCIIGEVNIPRNSNTPAVCRKLIHDWKEHKGRIRVYGDATGGARGTAKTEGSDWDIIKNELYAAFGSERVLMRVPDSNPTERSRINAVNSRLLAQSGEVRLMVDPAMAPNVVKDFEGVRLLEGGSGEIDKKDNPKLTHVSDAIGYYIVAEYPVRGEKFSISELRA